MIDALIEVLEAEGAALATGNVAVVADLQDRKAALSIAIREEAVSERDLRRIEVIAKRNERLLKLALDGVRQARQRIQSARDRSRRVGYDAGGGSVVGPTDYSISRV